MICLESSKLACSSKQKLFWVPHAKFAQVLLVHTTAATVRRCYSTVTHLGTLPTDPRKLVPISLLFDLLEQWKEEELPLRALQGPKLGSKIVSSWNPTRR